MPKLWCIPQYYPVVYCGIFICPMVLTCNHGYGGVHGCGVDRCRCSMPPDHPQCHPCYTPCRVTLTETMRIK